MPCEFPLLPFYTVPTNVLIKDAIFHKNAGSNSIARKKRPKANARKTSKISPVKFDHFLNLSCEYLDPNLINDEFLASDGTQLTILQNNIRSLNKNFHLVEETFANCTKLPEILAFSETKLNQNSPIPSLEGYSFERKDSPSVCGGVGVYVSNRINYSIRNDLDLDTDGCEDLWLEIGSSDEIGPLDLKLIYKELKV